MSMSNQFEHLGKEKNSGENGLEKQKKKSKELKKEGIQPKFEKEGERLEQVWDEMEEIFKKAMPEEIINKSDEQLEDIVKKLSKEHPPVQSLFKIYSKYIEGTKKGDPVLLKEIENNIKLGQGNEDNASDAVQELAAIIQTGDIYFYSTSDEEKILKEIKSGCKNLIDNLLRRIQSNIKLGRKDREKAALAIRDLAAIKYFELIKKKWENLEAESSSESSSRPVFLEKLIAKYLIEVSSQFSDFPEIKDKNLLNNLAKQIKVDLFLSQNIGDGAILAVQELASAIQIGLFKKFPSADQKTILTEVRNEKFLDRLDRAIKSRVILSQDSGSSESDAMASAGWVIRGLAAINFLDEKIFGKEKDSEN